MKFKYLYASVAVLALFGTTSVVMAKNSESGQASTMKAVPTPGSLPSPSKTMVENQEKVEVQNMGEDSVIQTETKEEENLGTSVSEKVQSLLDDESLEKGIGQEVKKFVQEQKQVQDKVQENLDMAGKRNGVLKSLIGPDYKALKDSKAQLEQNQMRIKNLEELKLQLTNKSDIAMVTETIQALVDQNTALQDEINSEESTASLFGWLFKMFVK
jgi:hypothetical protein